MESTTPNTRMKTPTHQLRSNKKVEPKNLKTPNSQKLRVEEIVEEMVEPKILKTPAKLQKPRRRKINKAMEIKVIA